MIVVGKKAAALLEEVAQVDRGVFSSTGGVGGAGKLHQRWPGW